jgi:hypothetical protein
MVAIIFMVISPLIWCPVNGFPYSWIGYVQPRNPDHQNAKKKEDMVIVNNGTYFKHVIPAKAGILQRLQANDYEIPAFAGMTKLLLSKCHC